MDNKQLQILLDNYFSLLGKAIDSARLHLEKNSGREDELYYKDMKHNKPYWMDEKKVKEDPDYSIKQTGDFKALKELIELRGALWQHMQTLLGNSNNGIQ